MLQACRRVERMHFHSLLLGPQPVLGHDEFVTEGMHAARMMYLADDSIRTICLCTFNRAI